MCEIDKISRTKTFCTNQINFVRYNKEKNVSLHQRVVYKLCLKEDNLLSLLFKHVKWHHWCHKLNRIHHWVETKPWNISDLTLGVSYPAACPCQTHGSQPQRYQTTWWKTFRSSCRTDGGTNSQKPRGLAVPVCPRINTRDDGWPLR